MISTSDRVGWHSMCVGFTGILLPGSSISIIWTCGLDAAGASGPWSLELAAAAAAAAGADMPVMADDEVGRRRSIGGRPTGGATGLGSGSRLCQKKNNKRNMQAGARSGGDRISAASAAHAWSAQASRRRSAQRSLDTIVASRRTLGEFDSDCRFPSLPSPSCLHRPRRGDGTASCRIASARGQRTGWRARRRSGRLRGRWSVPLCPCPCQRHGPTRTPAGAVRRPLHSPRASPRRFVGHRLAHLLLRLLRPLLVWCSCHRLGRARAGRRTRRRSCTHRRQQRQQARSASCRHQSRVRSGDPRPGRLLVVAWALVVLAPVSSIGRSSCQPLCQCWMSH